MQRYSRQTRFSPFGEEGQRALAAARVAVVGVGGLGSHLAEQLCRAGVGTLRLIDRDVVEESNLPRQGLFTAEDARRGLPKAAAAAEHLGRIESGTRLEVHCEDLGRASIHRLLSEADLVLDGLDNYRGRFLIGDWCHRERKPWVHGGAVGAVGSVFRVVPGGPCLRCLFPEPARDQLLPTCETDGVLSPLPALIASLQVSELMVQLAAPATPTRLWQIDAWSGRARCSTAPAPDPDCPSCAHGRYPALESELDEGAISLCGQDVVQVHPGVDRPLDLSRLAERWRGLGEIEQGPHLVRLHLEQHDFSVFRDGRALIRGASSVEQARSLYDRYIGS